MKDKAETVSDEFAKAAMNWPAIWCNSFQFTGGPGGMRLAFGEAAPGQKAEQAQPRIVVYLPMECVTVLVEGLGKLVEMMQGGGAPMGGGAAERMN